MLFVLIKKRADFFAAVLPELFKHEFKNKVKSQGVNAKKCKKFYFDVL